MQAMAGMNRGLNLPSIQKIMNDFERESSMMDMKENMMSDAIDDVMDEEEDEEEEEDKILKEVLDEIGVDLSQKVYHYALYPIAPLNLPYFTVNRCSNGSSDSIYSRKQAACCYRRAIKSFTSCPC